MLELMPQEVKFLEPIYPELYKQLMEIRSSKGFKKTQEERMDEDLTGEVGEINKTKQDGEDTEEGRNQALRDLLFGILRDWTYIAAGRPGPWTRPSRKSLNKLFFNSAIEAEEWFGSSFTNGNRGESQATEYCRWCVDTYKQSCSLS